MSGMLRREVRSGWAVLCASALVAIMFQVPGSTQNTNVRGADPNLTYSSGQSVVPAFHGWVKNPDGTFDMHFGYLNRNWVEEVDIPIGPDNNISAPYGPDAGQPTHFLPRNNRWQFKVRVPANFEGKEIVWTLTSRGQTITAHGVIKPGYVQDEFGLQREFYGSPPTGGNKWPDVRLEGEKVRAARVGQPITLSAIATDDGIPRAGGRGGGGGAEGAGQGAQARAVNTTGAVGGDSVRGSARGLRFAWYLYRSPQELRALTPAEKLVVFNPRQFKVQEDQRGGQDSPWSPGWVAPPIPPDNRWTVQATFARPGTYVVRGLAHDGLAWGSQDVTVTVTQ